MIVKGLARSAMVAVAAFGIASSADAAELGAVDEPIKIALFEWTGQHVTAHIAGHIFEKMGYKVEYVTAGIFPSATAVADGSITLGLELWDNNIGDFYPKLLAEGKVEDVGDVGLDSKEGWIYPKHFEEVCPGLPAWDALLACSQVLATAETFPKGRVLAYPADWGDRSHQLIEGEGLDFVAVPSGSEGALVAEMAAAIESRSPFVMMFWSPHWTLSNIEFEWVDIPDSLREKYSMVPPRTFNAAWPGMKDKWPAAYEFLKTHRISNDVQQPIMGAVDNDGGDMLELTRKWVEDNESYWRPLVDAAMM